MLELEYKFLLSEEKFLSLINNLPEEIQKGAEKPYIQVNYYFDTPDYAAHKEGVTVRIRQKNGRLQGQIKRHDKGKSIKSEEEYFTAEELPDHIDFEGKMLVYLGNLTCRRSSFVCDGYQLDFDESFYLGKQDYELEIEFEDGNEEKVRKLIQELGLEVGGKRTGKFSRFRKARDKQSDIK